MDKLSLLLSASLVLANAVYAEDDDRYELVIKGPDKDVPSWTVGDRQLKIGPDVEIKTSAGRLMAGSCVLVDDDEGTVTKVQTGPMIHCDKTDYAAFLAIYSDLAKQ